MSDVDAHNRAPSGVDENALMVMGFGKTAYRPFRHDFGAVRSWAGWGVWGTLNNGEELLIATFAFEEDAEAFAAASALVAESWVEVRHG